MGLGKKVPAKVRLPGPTWRGAGTRGLSSSLPCTCACRTAGALHLWIYGGIDTHQCSLQDLALTCQCYCCSLSIVRPRAIILEGVGEVWATAEGRFAGCLVDSGLWEAVGISQLRGDWKNWHPLPPPTQGGPKLYDPVTMLILNGNQSNIT